MSFILCALTGQGLYFEFGSLQTPCNDRNPFSICVTVTPDHLQRPKPLFNLRFGHSRSPAMTETTFQIPFRSIQTTCIDPNHFSIYVSVTPDLLQRPKPLFNLRFGHSRSPAMTESPLYFRSRSLQTRLNYIVPMKFNEEISLESTAPSKIFLTSFNVSLRLTSAPLIPVKSSAT
jgi:hypothetical protein